MTPRQYIKRYREFADLSPPARIFLHGDESLLKDGLIKAFRKPIEGVEDFCLDVFWMNELRGSDAHKAVFDALMSLPMLGDRRVVVLRSFNISRANEKRIIEGLENFSFPQNSILVVEAEKIDLRRKEGKRISKLFTVVELPVPGDSDMMEWINYFARRAGKRITMSAARELIRLAGISLCAIREEVNKLTNFVENDTISTEHICRITSKSRSVHIFQFSNALLELNYEGVMRSAVELMRFGETHSSILSWTNRALTDILWAKIDPAGLPERLNRRSFLAKKVRSAAGRVKTADILRAMEMLHRADVMVKTSQMDPKTAVVWVLSGIRSVLQG